MTILEEKKAIRDGFGEGLLKLGKSNKRVVVLTADLESSVRLTAFKTAFPQRFFQIGVAEQNMVGIAAGMALQGKLPFICSFAAFLARAWEQIRVAICLNGLNIKIVGSHAGFSHANDGSTAQATEDLAIMRVLPRMAVVVPADFNQTKQAVKAVANYSGPVYLRIARDPTSVFTDKNQAFVVGKAYLLKKGKDLTIVSSGPMVAEVLKAVEILEKEKISCEVINLATLKPIDKKTLISSAKKTGKVVTVEDHQVFAGVGSAVSEILSQFLPTPMKLIGLNNQFGVTARTGERLLKKFKLDSLSLAKQIKGWL